MKGIERKEITFELMEVYTVKTNKKEWIEIKVKITDEQGERIQIVRVGDVLKAQFDTSL